MRKDQTFIRTAGGIVALLLLARVMGWMGLRDWSLPRLFGLCLSVVLLVDLVRWLQAHPYPRPRRSSREAWRRQLVAECRQLGLSEEEAQKAADVAVSVYYDREQPGGPR